MAQNVKVYSTTTCPYCMMVKNFLEDNNIPYTNLDVGVDRNALVEMKNKSGQLGVPVIDVDGTIIVGFDKEALAKVLGLKATV
jgi:glutaredoxin-like YruB-family protein